VFIKKHKILITTLVIICLNFTIILPVSAVDISDEYISDGDLMVKSMEDALHALIDKPIFKNITISSIENLEDTSAMENTFTYDRLDDTFIKVLSINGLFFGKTGGGKTKDIETEIEIKKDEEKGTGFEGELLFEEGEPVSVEEEEDTSFVEEYEFTDGGDYTIQYRLLICKVDYENMKNWMKRRVATTNLYIRLYNSSTQSVEWAGEIYGFAEDIIPHEYVERLTDNRYVQIKIESGKEGERNPLLEPLLVSGITAGLILLFSITAKSSQ